MKTVSLKIFITVLIVVIFISQNSYSNDDVTIIKIDLDSQILQKEYSLPNGDYYFIIEGKESPLFTYHISISETTVLIPPIDISTINNSISTSNVIETYSFSIKERTKIEFIIKKKDKDSKVISEYNYKFNGIIKHKWHTTLGVAGIALLNTDTYKTKQLDNGHEIVQDGSQKIIDPVIVMMFTYINLEKPHSFGGTGGIGFDLEKISIYGGVSFYFGHNLVLTGGAALHQQLRLDNKYDVGQIVESPLSSDDLNSLYYRVNPFLSLTFALNKNIFKK